MDREDINSITSRIRGYVVALALLRYIQESQPIGNRESIAQIAQRIPVLRSLLEGTSRLPVRLRYDRNTPIFRPEYRIQERIPIPDFMEVFAVQLAEVARGSPTSVNLYSMIRTQIFFSVALVWYGRRNPYDLSFIRAAWHKFDEMAAAKSSEGNRGLDISPEPEWFFLAESLAEVARGAFWMLHWIITDSHINADCLHEIQHCVRQRGLASILNLEPVCPIFGSTCLETLRHLDVDVLESADMWGPGWDEFNHLRFFRGPLTRDGAEWAMCECFARRHMQPLTLGIVAVLLLRLELTPSRGDGDVAEEEWKEWAELPEPEHPFEVDVTLRL
ncbi:hypothetical protein F5B22DRAFT_657430 [Xylaria bambusicola]|uniref:uncharacterized protein n=1 Tax=Xylaria bambusicola TaxID=326684 RepID=UPI002008A4BD|nr:uncharacterized protein F5B22DRAFT_657430 [Xylaria bambusicola]KAI0512966.1 hypothetical protein F5B22DRAFT_657430 [Xylaria bambusicola]